MSDIFIKLSVDLRKDDTLAKLKGAPVSVLLALAVHINGKSECHPSIPTLAKLAGYDKRQVMRALDTLEALDLITRTRRFPRKRQTTNLYRVLRYFSYGRQARVKQQGNSLAEKADE